VTVLFRPLTDPLHFFSPRTTREISALRMTPWAATNSLTALVRVPGHHRAERSGVLGREVQLVLRTPLGAAPDSENRSDERRSAVLPTYAVTMGNVFASIDEDLQLWIEEQPMWFVATAPLVADGHVNVSPRGHDSFSVLGPRRVGWVDYTGSGIETIAHLRENGRVCLMFNSFGRRPRIVRLHGRGSVFLPGEAEFEEVASLHPEHPSTRAVIMVDISRISDSCGWGVPIMEMTEERNLLRMQADKKGVDGMADYREERNGQSIDGLPGFPT